MTDGSTRRGSRGTDALCIAGPTAAGKSALALAIAARWPVEIVSVDSAQVYRGMDIGTAKPSTTERAAVPHHLIDIVDPREAYSAARFVTDARRLIDEIGSRGRIALLVGGTMLYFKALADGLDEMPAADAAVRGALAARASREGWPALHAELRRVDPVTAERLPPHDAQRIQRALEVWQLSGRPLSDWQVRGRHGGARLRLEARDSWAGSGAPGLREPANAGVALPLIALEPTARSWLHERIALRFDAMLAAGLIDEVRALRARGDLSAELPSMRSVGYRQVWGALDADDLEHVRERGIAATRQLAKRQLTWLRSMPGRTTVACDEPAALERALAVAGRWLG